LRFYSSASPRDDGTAPPASTCRRDRGLAASQKEFAADGWSRRAARVSSLRVILTSDAACARRAPTVTAPAADRQTSRRSRVRAGDRVRHPIVERTETKPVAYGSDQKSPNPKSRKRCEHQRERGFTVDPACGRHRELAENPAPMPT